MSSAPAVNRPRHSIPKGFFLNLIRYAFKQSFGRQENVRVPEPEVMETEEQAHEYEAAMRVNWTHSLVIGKLARMLPENARVLEVGCGPGLFLTSLARRLPHAQFTGVDLSSAMLERARNNAHTRELKNVSFTQHDMYRVQDLDGYGTWDAICISLTLHHCRDTEHAVQLIESCRTALAPGGTLFVFDFVRPKTEKIGLWIASAFCSQFGKFLYEDALASFRAAFSFNEVEDIARRAGWTRYNHNEQLFGVYQWIYTPRRFLRPARFPGDSFSDTLFLWLQYVLMHIRIFHTVRART